MRDVHRERPRFEEPDEPDVLQYRAVSTLALLAVVAAMLSVLALVSPVLWILSLVGVVLAAAALRRIAAFAPTLIGRKAAQFALALSLVLLAAAPARWFANRALVRQEARRFSQYYFDFLAADEPLKAHQLTAQPYGRESLDVHLRTYYAAGEQRKALEGYLQTPEVRALLALGDRAVVRFFDTEMQWEQGPRDLVYQTYAATYHSEGEPTTFFVGVIVERSVDEKTAAAYWRVVRTVGGVRPKALGGSGSPEV